MNVQFNQLQAINVQEFNSSINNIQNTVADTDATLSSLASQYIDIYDGSASTAYGTWGMYNLFAKGSGFSGDHPVVTSVKLTHIFDETIYQLNGTVNALEINPYTYAITGGNFSAINFKNGTTDSTVKGSFLYTELGDLGGGTISSAIISNEYSKLTLTGSLTLNANEDVTGTISAFTYTNIDGANFSISNASIAYGAFHDFVMAQADFSAVSNYLLDETNLAGNDVITGDAESNALYGYAGNDTLTGNAGNDSLDGGAGIDSLIGGLGDDTYTINLVQTGTTLATYKLALQDTITEAANAGNDTLILRGNGFTNSNATTLTLAGTLENIDASQTGSTNLNLTGNGLANIITGNDASNILNGAAGIDQIYGGAGNDTLDGGTGIDDLWGGTDDDTYIVDILGDTVHEASNEGNDTVKYNIANSTSISQTLTVGTGLFTNIENITVLGSGLYNLVGDSNDNILIGNATANILTGGDGMDFLDGKVGADTMIGGIGVDTYVVDSTNDVVIEQPGEGDLDMINSFVSFDLSTKGANVEYLQLVGTATNGTGNDLNNGIFGNSLANVLKGGAGNDSINGGLGNDILDGGVDIDTMEGGQGNDTYLVDDVDDIVIETFTIAQGGGVDLVKSSVSYTLSANVDNLTLTDGTATGGTTSLNGTGNELNNILTGNAGDNLLDGGAGKDVLKGGAGNDTYIVDLVQTGTTDATYRVALEDTITEAANAGNDTLILRGSYDHQFATTLTLASTLENLNASLTGTTKLNLTGNALNNIVIGNDADNVITGGAGSDTLDGGNGYDYYILDSINDVVSDSGGTSDVDIIAANFNIDLLIKNYEGVENIGLYGTSNLSIKGNDLSNYLAGNEAANIVDGRGGNDTLLGFGGHDTIHGGEGDDYIYGENSYSGFAFNTSKDQLYGDAGNDTLIGGGGSDTLTGGTGLDVFSYADITESQLGILTRDVITDFTHGEDIVDLFWMMGSESAFTYIGSSAFSNQIGQLRFDSGSVYGDVNGDGKADFEIALTGITSMDASDFIL